MLSCGSSRGSRSQRAVTAIATYNSANQMTPLTQAQSRIAQNKRLQKEVASVANVRTNPTGSSSSPPSAITHGQPALNEKMEVQEHQV